MSIGRRNSMNGEHVKIQGKFVKEFVRGMKKHGQYRGEGAIEITEAGIALTGKHVFSVGQRWLFGLAVAIGITIATLGTLAPGILLMYPVVEYLWLKRGNQLITFDRVEAYNAVPEKNLIAIQFNGTRWEAPAVMKSTEWQSIYDALWSHVPTARVA
jgi:hypothetical protein